MATNPINLTVYFFCSAFSCSALSAANEYPELSIQGENYPNACAPAEKEYLHDTLLASKVENPAQAWRAIDAILCAPNNDTNRSYVETLVPRTVRKTVESTGDKPTFKMVARSEALARGLMAAGKAWDANIRTEPGKITLQYFANEACVKERTLTYVNFKWSVYAIGEACD
jgi:hypothetical protein